jgi:NADH-quinone oxidoreductase subunit N
MKTILLLSGIGAFALLAEIFRLRKILIPVIFLGLLATIGAALYDWNTHIHYYHNMLTFDNYALAFSIALCAGVFIWLFSSLHFFADLEHLTDKSSLFIFSLIGAVILVSYSNLTMLFLGIEILSIPLYVLAGSNKDSATSNESALKYFLMGAFASAILLFGIALLYGACGTFDLSAIHQHLSLSENSSKAPALLNMGILLLFAGIAFKAAVVPFHFWTPDVYEGAPTPVTAFMSFVVKTAAFAAFFRLFSSFSTLNGTWMHLAEVLTCLTILIGNSTAVYQNKIKRMLAYSSIAHAGYLMLAMVAMNDTSAQSILFYSIAYCISTIGSFAVISWMEENGNEATMDSFKGLAQRSPLAAFATTVFLLSLAGIPPMAGFCWLQ